MDAEAGSSSHLCDPARGGARVGWARDLMVKKIEAARLPRRTVEDPHVLFQVPAHRGARRAESRYAPLDHFLLPPALFQPGGILLVAGGHVLELEEDALSLVPGLAPPQLFFQGLDPVPQGLPLRGGGLPGEMGVVADTGRA